MPDVDNQLMATLADAEVEKACVYKLSQFEYSAEYDARVLQEALMTARAAAERIPNARVKARPPHSQQLSACVARARAGAGV